MNSITYKNKTFKTGNKVWFRGKEVGTIRDIETNTDEKEINLWIENKWNKLLLLTMWRNKVFINQSYRGKLVYLLGDTEGLFQ
jgi:paraquat-inducible protein B